MILVDTSALVDYFKGTCNPASTTLNSLIENGADLGISPYTFEELLQGARDEVEYARLKRVLSTQEILWLPQTLEIHEQAARLFFDLRRTGVTVRSTIDMLIALTAIYHHVPLLHNDRDFDRIASHMKKLTVYPV